MEQSLEYLAKNHPRLSKDYRTKDGKYSESCAWVAMQIAKILIGEGKIPYLTRIRGKLVDTINRESIVPKLSSAKIKWGAHQVCCVDGFAYDPMVDAKPIPIRDYCKKAFHGEVKMDVVIPKKEIVEFIS